jgi:serine/threonine protein kinase
VLPNPERFADFLLLQRIAAGGMGEILLAIRLGDRSGRTFVVKRPLLGERPSGRAAQAIAREGEVLSAVRAPGLIALEAAGDIAGLPYIAIEHVRGAALDAILEGRGPLPAAAVRAIALDLATALAALHASGWVHGDVAPSNILLDDAGELRLIDLGLATRAGAKHIEIAGKPGYIAPEAVRPVEAAPAEDIYGLGVVVAECALGRRLFREESLAEAGARGEAPPEAAALDDIAPGLARALRRDPSARPDAASLVERLRGLELDRGALAELAAQPVQSAALTAQPIQSAALTPTAPMVVAAQKKERGALGPPNPALARTLASASEGESKRAGAGESKRAGAGSAAITATTSSTSASASANASNAWKRVAITLLVLIGLAVSAAAGRLSARRRDGAVSIAGSLPRRTQIELDGRPAPRLADSPAPLEPGRHTVVISLPKGERREYPFNVRPGEHVVLLPVNRAGNADP